MTTRERRPNPHSNPEYSQEDLQCMAEELVAHDAWLEEGYQAARLARFEQNQREWEQWREEQRAKREQEKVESDARRDAFWEEHPHLAPWQWRKERG